MGFIMDGLDAEEFDRKYGDGVLIRRILTYFRPQSRKMVIAALMITGIAALEAGIPIFVARSLDWVSIDPAPLLIVALATLLAVLGIASWLLNLVRQTLSSQAVGAVVLQMREDAVEAVLHRDLSFYDQFASGKIVSRVNSDSAAFTQVISLTMDLISRVLLVVFIVGYLATISLTLTMVLLLLAPFIVATALAFRSIARRTITASRRMNARVSSYVSETMHGIGVAKTFRQEPAIHAEFSQINVQSQRVNMRTRYVFSAIFPLLNLMAGVGTAALVYFGGLSVQSGALTIGTWFLFIQGLQSFWFPLTSIASFWSQFQLGLAAGERIFALIDAEPRVVQHDQLIPPTLHGAISFAQVSFAYKPGEPVLQDFNLHIRAGETLALVGHTGSGKSSIAKLVARFYEFQSGQITIDGIDIRALDLAAYRSRLGIVTQSPFLFGGTVRENIRYGRPTANDEEVLAAAAHIGGGDWITSLPQGLDSEVGKRGGQLSMGQRQLVALARVLLQNPAIIILDEATASVDPLTEALIQEGVETLLAGRTSLVIAHRLSTVRTADRIVVLRKGTIIEEGSHDLLMTQGGYYAELYNTYFRHQSLAYIERLGTV